jgi:hypothetical protein
MTTSTAPSVTPEEAAVLADQAAPLDALLIDAALGSARRFVPDLSTAKLGVALVRKPRTTARRLGSLVAETGRIAIGTSTVTPSRRDRRFADAAWTSNPLLRRIVQLYLAGAQTADELVADADLDWRDDTRMRFQTENLVEAVSPSNVPLVNPAVGQGNCRQRWVELRPRRGPIRARYGVATAYPGDGRPFAVRGGPQYRHDARARSCCALTCSS